LGFLQRWVGWSGPSFNAVQFVQSHPAEPRMTEDLRQKECDVPLLPFRVLGVDF
jgi:hypothetical protein